jgi:hypothetical protein
MLRRDRGGAVSGRFACALVTVVLLVACSASTKTTTAATPKATPTATSAATGSHFRPRSRRWCDHHPNQHGACNAYFVNPQPSKQKAQTGPAFEQTICTGVRRLARIAKDGPPPAPLVVGLLRKWVALPKPTDRHYVHADAELLWGDYQSSAGVALETQDWERLAKDCGRAGFPIN